MVKDLITRRTAIARLSAVPFASLAARLSAQSHPARVRRVVLGMYHSLLIDSDGTLKCWSHGPTRNSAGEFGLGHFDQVEKFKLYQVPGLTNVVAAGTGWDMSFAVLGDGRVLSWGESRGGMLGTTPLSYVEVYAEAEGSKRHTPTPVVAHIDGVDISVGDAHVLALARDGAVWAWGDGGNGRLGVGGLPVITFKTHTPRAMSFVPFPVQIPGLTGVAAISAGGDHSLALLQDGTIRAWGSNKFGQLGDGTTINRTSPVLVPGIGKVSAIAAGVYCSAAVLADGRVLTWGSNVEGMLGRPGKEDGTPSPVPGLVPGVADARAVAVADAMVVLTHAGTVVSWGSNKLGQLGRGAGTPASAAPGAVKGLSGVHSVTALVHASLAVLHDGRIAGWGATNGRPWMSLRGGSGDIRANSPTPILINVDGLDNG